MKNREKNVDGEQGQPDLLLQKDIMNSIQEALLVLDEDWRFIYTSEQACRTLELTYEQLVGKNIWELFPQLIGRPTEEKLHEAMLEHKIVQFEDYFPRLSNWYEVRAYPFQAGLTVWFQNITARKRTQEALKESEELFRILNEASFEGIVIHDKSIILAANPRMTDLFGYDQAEIIGMSTWDLILPEDKAGLAQLRSLGYEGTLESLGKRKDGTLFPMEARGRYVIYKGQQVRVGCFRDVSERKQREQALKESEEWFRTLGEASFDAIFIQDRKVVIEVNQQAMEMFGYSREEFLGKPLLDLIPPENWPDLEKMIAIGFDGPNESRAMKKDGTRFPVEVYGKYGIYKGQPIRITSVRDISQRKQAEEKLRKTQEQLWHSQKMESVGRLAGGVAHDFNNLLTAITGYSELILGSLDEEDLLYQDVLEIQKASERAANLTRQLLAFSRQQVLQPRPVNLNELVANVDKLVRRLIGEDIELISEFEPNLSRVLVDPGQIEQVIVNLVINARDAMPNGGRLIIETANVELDEEYFAQKFPTLKTGAYVMLAVSDNGIGMDEATQIHIFEPFFTTKEPGKGTGLGLATVYGIVNQSEGQILVYSEVGVGTTFKIYLPGVVDGEESEAVPEPEQESRPQLEGTETILLAEDEEMVRNLISLVLKGKDYNLLEARNGEEALQLLQTYPGSIDLLVTDIIMPQLGGRELVMELNHIHPRAKVLCMSGYTDRAFQQHDLFARCEIFLQKPFTPSTLVSKVREVLDS